MYVNGAVVIVILAISAVVALCWHVKPEYSQVFSVDIQSGQLGCVTTSDPTAEDIADRVHDISFNHTALPGACDHPVDRDAKYKTSDSLAQASSTESSCPKTLTWEWKTRGSQCGPSRLNRKQASALLQCKHVLFIGDSIIRNLALSVASLLAAPDDPPFHVDRHADMVFASGCNTTVTFLWRPFLANVTQAMADWPVMAQQPLAHVITGVALWDILHITNTSAYAAEADAFAEGMAQLLESQPSWQMWWATTTAVHPDLLQTDEKRATMTESTLRAYRELQRARVQQRLRHSDAFHVLDVHAITRQAPASSSADGIHFPTAVYDAGAQALLTMVRAGGFGDIERTCLC